MAIQNPQKPLAGDELVPYEREDELAETRCPDCGNPPIETRSHQWCIRCAQDISSTHPTGKPPNERLRIENRFWSKVDIRERDQCWPWQAYRDPNGYGRFLVGDNMQSAHRAAYMLDKGLTNPDDLPDGEEIRHLCHNPPCCNPAHLGIGTSANRIDSLRAGDIDTKLDPDEVREIRRRGDSETYAALADEFGVSAETIRRTYLGEQYAWVE